MKKTPRAHGIAFGNYNPRSRCPRAHRAKLSRGSEIYIRNTFALLGLKKPKDSPNGKD